MNEQKKYEVIKKLVDTNGNKARSPVRTVSKQLRAQIDLLYENKYFDKASCSPDTQENRCRSLHTIPQQILHSDG